MERPWSSGKFLISAGLKPLGDKPVFENEENLQLYLDNKKTARKESLRKYYPEPIGLSSSEIKEVADSLKSHLLRDLPHFHLDSSFEASDEVDFIISQVPEDFSVWKMEKEEEWLALIHLSGPNHWDAREKIGKSFLKAHLTIPHIDPISKAAPKLFEQVIKRGAFERFAWGVATDKRLNHHPEPPPGITTQEWQGRSFDPEAPALYIRMERQTIFPISKNLVGFTIKTKFHDVSILPSQDLKLISQCMEGMDDKILTYKGLHKDKNNIVNWISSLGQ